MNAVAAVPPATKAPRTKGSWANRVAGVLVLVDDMGVLRGSGSRLQDATPPVRSADIRGNYGERRVEFDVVAGSNVDLGVFELEATVGIRGRVENSLGETLDVPLLARRPGQPAPVGAGDFRNFGELFLLGQLPPGEIWVTVDAPDWASFPVRFEVHGGILEDVVVSAHEGTPLTLVRSPSARGRTRASIWTAGGQVAWNGMLDIGERATMRLVPGSYTLRSEPDAERTLTVGADAQSIEL